MKKTPLLESVLQLLSEAQKPLSVPSIQAQLADKNLSPNKTTLYRMLEKLNQSDQVEVLLLDPKVTYYELKTHHHHHFCCESCDSIECVTDPELESQIHKLEHQLEQSGLKINHHQFSFSGCCQHCQ